MNAAAVAAADFKNGFGSQFMQPFGDTDSLYSSYSPYNNWATKVPSPLGVAGSKSFPWPVVNPLGSVVAAAATHQHHHHHQQTVNCFNATATSVSVSMNSMNMNMGGGGVGVGGQSSVNGVGGQTTSGLNGLGGLNAGSVAPPCPYTAPANPYTSMYHHASQAAAVAHHRVATEAAAVPLPAVSSMSALTSSVSSAVAVPAAAAMSTSIATLRLKAKQHTASGGSGGSAGSSVSGGGGGGGGGGFSVGGSPYSVSPSPVSRSGSAGLSACQYAGVADSV